MTTNFKNQNVAITGAGYRGHAPSRVVRSNHHKLPCSGQAVPE
jgi:hypothetical protein